MSTLESSLKQEIERQGALSFARFMEVALYAPEAGYYESERHRIGVAGDFYTSTSTGSLFGQLLAFAFADWLEPMRADRLWLVEAGAHDGQLASDILGSIGKSRPALMGKLEYWIVEPSSRRRAWQQEKLAPHRRQIRWCESLQELPERGVDGVMFSNELLDAFPIHRLGWNAFQRQWFEWGVGWDGSNFTWQRLPGALLPELHREMAQAGLDCPAELLAALPDEFTLDLCPAARTWWQTAAQRLRQGKLMTIDYGFEALDFLSPLRASGTLRAYRRHQMADHPLAEPGQQDLTAHVNFTQLQRAGASAGLQSERLTSQTAFLTEITEDLWRTLTASEAWTFREAHQFQTLTHPDHLGRAFRVLIQSRPM